MDEELSNLLTAQLNLKHSTVNDFKNLPYIHMLCAHNHLNILQTFLENNPHYDINAQISKNHGEFAGYTALHFAAANGHLDMVDYLLKLEADFTLQAQNNSTAIHLAHYNNHDEIVELMLSFHHRNSATCPTDSNNISHFHLACAYSSSNIIRSFVKSKSSVIDIRIDDCSPIWPGCSPLHVAVKFENVSAVKILLAAGANPNAIAKDGVTVLHFACEMPMNSNIISCLLEKGADPNAVDEIRMSTPFRDYLLRSRLDLVYKFVSSGADVNKRLENGKTVLHVVFSRTEEDGYKIIDNHHFELATYGKDLLNLDSSDLDAQDSAGRTPLHYACLRHHVDEMNFLITYGADIEIVDNDGKTPLNCCQEIDCLIKIGIVPYVDRLIRHGFYISKQNLDLMKKIPFPENKSVDIEHELVELEDLKKNYLSPYDSFYDILFKSPGELVNYAEHPVLREEVMHEFFVANYWKFGSILMKQFRKGKARGVILKPAKKALFRLTGKNLPDSCWEKVIDFLDNKSIKNLVDTDTQVSKETVNIENI